MRLSRDKVKRMAIGLIFFCGMLAQAQESVLSLEDMQSEIQERQHAPVAAEDGQAKTASQKLLGSVDVLVSEVGQVKSSAVIKINGEVYRTNQDGFLSMELPAGRHLFQVGEGATAEPFPVRIVAGERTQLIVNWLSQQHELLEPQTAVAAQKITDQALGSLVGKVESVAGGPVGGVRIVVKNSEVTTTTNSAGVYQLALPVGEHTISWTHPKYSSEIIRDIKVGKDQPARKDLLLTPTALVLEDFVVLSPRLAGSIEAMIEVRRQSAEVADVMSAEQMAKSGDGDAGASLRRVTGLTLVDGKYVYVRGLGERYSSTLMNGISLPSPDPAKRVVPLDIFPVHILDSLTIQKSFSPDMPGEFGGGTVVLNTKAVPDRSVFKASIGQSIHSQATRIRTYPGGQQDWLGIDDGGRQLPASLQSGRADPSVFKNKNRHTIGEQAQDTLPELSFALGNSTQSLAGWKNSVVKVGYTMSAAYGDQVTGRKEVRNKYQQVPGDPLDEYNQREKISRERNLGGIAGLGLVAFKRQKVDANLVLLRQTEDYVSESFGEDSEGRQFRETDRQWAENEIRMLQFRGENKLPGLRDLTLNWHWAESKAQRYEPDKITDFYDRPVGGGEYSFRGLGADKAYERRFFNLRDTGRDLAAAVTVKAPWFYNRQAEITGGAGQVSKNRFSGMRRFVVENANDSPFGTANSPVNGTETLDVLFAKCPSCFEWQEATRGTDTYAATQIVDAYHFKTQIPLLSNVDLSTGMRYEWSRQGVTSFPVFGTGLTQSQLETQDWLPGNALTWRMNEKMQMRLAYSETVSRPDFMELSDTLWRDFDLDEDVEGNPSLTAAVIDSYDLRWEWYYTRKGNFSLGAFYKQFANPIEQIFTPGSDSRITFVNSAGAELMGAEMEFAIPVGAFTVSGNYALMASEISLENVTSADLASAKRPLQGQSDFAANLLLDYRHEPTALNLSLAYNVYGKRIYLLDPNGLPDIYENPFHQVDFIFTKRLSQTVRIGGKINNLLDPELRFTQGNDLWRGFRRGRALGLSLAMEI